MPYGCLDAISDRLAKENADHRQSLALVQICRNIFENRNHREIISSIYIHLKNNEKRQFKKEHFVLVMQLEVFFFVY